MKQYLEMLEYVLKHGEEKSDRTGTGTLAIFGYEMRFDLQKGFPLVTTKQMHLKSIIHELLWFLRGDTNINYLHDNGVTIWNEWADKDSDIGPCYGFQWRKWTTNLYQEHYPESIDQINVLINNLKNNPDSRRHLVSAWNVGDLPDMKLPPCHFAFQCQVMNQRLNMKVFLRSLDIFLGAPFDIASYAFLLQMFCKLTGYFPGELIISATDVHLYNNHFEQAKLQLTREPQLLPKFEWKDTNHIETIDDFKYNDLFEAIHDYQFYPAIKAPIAV